MTSAPPPSRYRVVEKGRRLVVIDRQSGEPATRDRIAATREAAPLGPERIAFDGRATLVTRPFYDDKAPRRLVLDEGTARWLENARSLGIGVAVLMVVAAILIPQIVPIAVIAIVALVNGKSRARLRAGLTAWLDRFDTAQ